MGLGVGVGAVGVGEVGVTVGAVGAVGTGSLGSGARSTCKDQYDETNSGLLAKTVLPSTTVHTLSAAPRSSSKTR